MEQVRMENVYMRTPEEGPSPAGADPGGEELASGQRPGRRTRPGRVQPEISPTIQRDQAIPEVSPASSVARGNAVEPTNAGLPRQRMRWTNSMNRNVLRIYYRVTNCEREKSGYGQKLYAEFQRMYPELAITLQRVTDQYRVIVRRNLIPEIERELIKSEVEAEINNESQQPGMHHASNIESQSTPSEIIRTETEGIQSSLSEVRQIGAEGNFMEELTIEMRNLIALYEGTDPTLRPQVPRVEASRKLHLLIGIMNRDIIPQHLPAVSDLESLQLIVYCGAIAVANALRLNFGDEVRIRRCGKRTIPPWERRLTNTIDRLRSDIARVEALVKGVNTKRLQNIVANIIKRHKRHTQWDQPNVTPTQCLDTLKQKLSVVSTRLARYRVSRKRKADNFIFNVSEKKFYRTLNKCYSSTESNYPTRQQITSFWSKQLSTGVEHNINADWIRKEESRMQGTQSMNYHEFSVEEVRGIIKGLHNWKLPGPDKIQNFWLKRFTCLHLKLTDLINDVIQNPSHLPKFLTQGVTYLLEKDPENRNDPSKYRPITCLPTLYKIITSCLTLRITKYCDQNNIITEQQKGCRAESKGCKEQLVIDSIVCGQAYKGKRNLSMAYIDYKKAFDSVPHGWLLKVLEIYKIAPIITLFLRKVMAGWSTKVSVRTPTEYIETENIPIRRGIFQGDSLSPIWFVLCLNPLSGLLSLTKCGFSIKLGSQNLYRLNHLLFVDDLKLYGANRNELSSLLRVVETFSKDISMEFGLDKCKTLNVTRGKLEQTPHELEDGAIIEAMSAGEVYKYLGMRQSIQIEQGKMKKDITREFTKRIRSILKSGLNSRNMIKAINTYAVPVLNYTFGILDWSNTEIVALQRKCRVLMTKARKHHPRSSVERTMLPRHMGGRGLVDINNQRKKQVDGLRRFFLEKASTSPLHKAVCRVDTSTPLQLSLSLVLPDINTTHQKIIQWMAKPLHGRHPNEVNQEHIDGKGSNYWLVAGQLFPETEGYMVAIQDQVIPTKNYLKGIVKDSSVTDDLCRYGCNAIENIHHVTAVCTSLVGLEYVERHNSVAKILHQQLALQYGLLPTERTPYYKYQPEPVLESSNYRLYYDRTILTDRSVSANRPDIVLVHKEKKQVWLIDIAIPNNNNVQAKHQEKVSKYHALAELIKKQWKIESVKTIPIIISTSGLIPKNLHNGLKELDVPEHLWRIMQKAVIIATTRIVRKFLGT